MAAEVTLPQTAWIARRLSFSSDETQHLTYVKRKNQKSGVLLLPSALRLLLFCEDVDH